MNRPGRNPANNRSTLSTRRAILDALKREGRLTARELAEQLGITVAGIRQHLMACHHDGVVSAKPRRSGLGRPTLVYGLTKEGQRIFGQRYDRIALEVLENAFRIGGGELIDRIFAERQKNLIKQYGKEINSNDLGERLRELARLRDAEGYMAHVATDGNGHSSLVELHCPISEIAKRYPALCQCELQLLRAAIGSEFTVDRAEHILDGDHVCRYVVRPERPA